MPTVSSSVAAVAVGKCGGMLAYVYRTTGELHSRVGVKGLE